MSELEQLRARVKDLEGEIGKFIDREIGIREGNAHRQAMQAVIDFLQKKYKVLSDRGREAARVGNLDARDKYWEISHEIGGMLGAMNGYLALADRYSLSGRGLPPEHQRQPDDVVILMEVEMAHMREEIAILSRRLVGAPS